MRERSGRVIDLCREFRLGLFSALWVSGRGWFSGIGIVCEDSAVIPVDGFALGFDLIEFLVEFGADHGLLIELGKPCGKSAIDVFPFLCVVDTLLPVSRPLGDVPFGAAEVVELTQDLLVEFL